MGKLLRIVDSNWRLLTIFNMTLIAVLSLYPLDSLPPFPGTDKTHHFIAYAILCFPVALSKPKSWLSVVTGILIFSGVIELIQPYVNRYGEWLDMAANALGIIVGIVFATAVKIISKYDAQVEQ